MNDLSHMRHALALGRRGIGRTGPNPSVGCVIVGSDGRIVGRARTSDGGRPHAEANALAMAGSGARGATAYVTLEPCAQVTDTPSCAESLIAAGVARVVVAIGDLDPRTNGQGITKLRDAGIAVVYGVLEREATESHAGFFMRTNEARPLVTLKVAQSLDGMTASASGDSKWITGEESRRYAHLMRAQHDAILIGIDTVLADDPELTSRLPGLETHSPIRVVLDTRLRLPETAKIVTTAKRVPTIVFTVADSHGDRLRGLGVEVVQITRDARGRPDLSAMLTDLAKRKVTRLLVEGGATVHAAFLDRGLADRLEIFTAPIALGAAGRNSLDALAALTLQEAPRFRRVSQRQLGIDLLESYVAKA